jgi:acetyltransferase-like isoleucine patch superfamily enzyme
MKWLLRLGRLIPIFGWLANGLRFPGLKTGLHVEIGNSGVFSYGRVVSVGECSRVDVAAGGRIEISDDVHISRSVHLASGAGHELKVGAHTTIQDDCRIYGDVTIGQRCILAPNIFISSGTHVFDAFPHLPIQEQERIASDDAKPVKLYDDCWLGINTVISRGVTIGRGCVIGANAVVTRDLPPYSVAAGNPARAIRQRLEFFPKERIDSSVEFDDPYFYDGFDLDSPRSDGKITNGNTFTLALQRRDARKLRMSVAGNAATISYDVEHRLLNAAPVVIEFDLNARADISPFIQLIVVGTARVSWAELL